MKSYSVFGLTVSETLAAHSHTLSLSGTFVCEKGQETQTELITVFYNYSKIQGDKQENWETHLCYIERNIYIYIHMHRVLMNWIILMSVEGLYRTLDNAHFGQHFHMMKQSEQLQTEVNREAKWCRCCVLCMWKWIAWITLVQFTSLCTTWNPVKGELQTFCMFLYAFMQLCIMLAWIRKVIQRVVWCKMLHCRL